MSLRYSLLAVTVATASVQALANNDSSELETIEVVGKRITAERLILTDDDWQKRGPIPFPQPTQPPKRPE